MCGSKPEVFFPEIWKCRLVLLVPATFPGGCDERLRYSPSLPEWLAGLQIVPPRPRLHRRLKGRIPRLVLLRRFLASLSALFRLDNGEQLLGMRFLDPRLILLLEDIEHRHPWLP